MNCCVLESHNKSPEHHTHLHSLRGQITNGLSPTERNVIWKVLTHTWHACEGRSELYRSLLSRHSSQMGAIRKDVGRTFPSVALFSTAESYGQRGIFNILSAYAAYDPEVGYCQGMGFIVGLLLIYLEDHETAFWAFVYIMQCKDWRGTFKARVPKVSVLLDTLTRQIESHLLDVHLHFQEQDFNMNCFSGALMTFFACKTEPVLSAKVLDLFLLDGECGLLSLVLRMIELKREKILKLKTSELYIYCMEHLIKESFSEYSLEVLTSPLGTDVEDGEFTVL